MTTLTYSELHVALSTCIAAANEMVLAARAIDSERMGNSTATAAVALAALQLTIAQANAACPALKDVIKIRRRLRGHPEATTNLREDWLDSVQGLDAADRFESAYIREIGVAAWDAIPIRPELMALITAVRHVMAMRREAGE